MTETVFHIQRFSLHDGPGIRTSIFLKGCPMRCFWCHNPEGRYPLPEIRYFPDRCIACGKCVDRCPHHAHEVTGGKHFFLRERCMVEAQCVETCFSQALQLNGRSMTIEDMMKEILLDYPFYVSSNGGITLTGGEPVTKGAYTRELLQRCKEQGIHTAIETCGEYDWQELQWMLPFIDLVMMDLKHMDSQRHQDVTGKPNDRILANARQLALTEKPVIFRTPVIPTVNDSEKEIAKIARFIQELQTLRHSTPGAGNGTARISYELLTYHELATDKYHSLGKEYHGKELHPPSKQRMQEFVNAAKLAGVNAVFR